MIAALKDEFHHPRVRDVFVFGRSTRKQVGPVRNYSEPPRPLIYSLLKTGRRAVQWVYTYYTKLQPLSSKRTLVICDHFRFLVLALDPLKFRYGGPRRLLWWLFDALPQPDLFIVLDVSAEVARSRKQESSLEEFHRVINEQQANLYRLKHVHVVDATKPLEQVVRDVSQMIMGELDHPETKDLRAGTVR